MIRLVQYIVLLFLIANGMSAHLGQQETVHLSEDCELIAIEIGDSTVTDADTENEADNGNDEDRDNNSREFLVSPERKLLRETAQNDPEPATSAIAILEAPKPYTKANHNTSDWTLSFWDTYPKISIGIKRNIYYSKQPSDSAITKAIMA